MKLFTLLLCLFLPAFLAAQCDYDQLFREGKAFQKQRLYKKALYKFNSARRCDPAKGETVDAAIESLLDQVEGEKKAADTERERVEDALAEVKKQQDKNEKIINAFYFYADKYALAFKDGKYGFIDKDGNVVINYEYDEALPFDKMGFARVKQIAKSKNNNDINESKYLIDTSGNAYPLAIDSIDIDINLTKAIDLSYKKLTRDYANIYESKKLF